MHPGTSLLKIDRELGLGGDELREGYDYVKQSRIYVEDGIELARDDYWIRMSKITTQLGMKSHETSATSETLYPTSFQHASKFEIPKFDFFIRRKSRQEEGLIEKDRAKETLLVQVRLGVVVDQNWGEVGRQKETTTVPSFSQLPSCAQNFEIAIYIRLRFITDEMQKQQSRVMSCRLSMPKSSGLQYIFLSNGGCVSKEFTAASNWGLGE